MTNNILTKEQFEWVIGVLDLLKNEGCDGIQYISPKQEETEVIFTFCLRHPQKKSEILSFVLDGKDFADTEYMKWHFKITDPTNQQKYVNGYYNYRKDYFKGSALELAEVGHWFYMKSYDIYNKLLNYEAKHPYREVFDKNKTQEHEL